MEIENSENIITNSQLEEIINLLGEEYRPRRILVFESLIENVRFRINNFYHISECDLRGMSELQNGQTVKYNILTDTLKIYLYNKKQINDKEEEQVNFIYDFVVELKRRYCVHEKMKEKQPGKITVLDFVDNYALLFNEPYGSQVYKFASNFMNENAEGLSSIMNWKEQWKFDE